MFYLLQEPLIENEEGYKQKRKADTYGEDSGGKKFKQDDDVTEKSKLSLCNEVPCEKGVWKPA